MIEIRNVEDPASIAAARSLVRAHIVAASAIHDVEAAERIVAALPAPYVAPHGSRVGGQQCRGNSRDVWPWFSG
jgi:hypothetical protein